MDAFISTAYVLANLAALVGAPVWTLGRLARPAGLSRAALMVRTAGVHLLALVTPAALLLSLIGVEELARRPLVPERIALFTLAFTVLQAGVGLAALLVQLLRRR